MVQTKLPSRVTLPPPASDPVSVDGGPHTIHQLLLVLNYLFVSAMLPEDNGALGRIIYRSESDWEESFLLQYDRQLWWLLSARNILTQAEDIHSVSLEDLELQISYLLFALGQHASPTRSFFHKYQRPCPPYRPFGVRASIALICYTFMSIHAADISGYNYKEIWIRDQEIFSTMSSRLQHSPLFSAEIPAHQLQSIILSLQRAFQHEEIRVASTEPRSFCIGNASDRIEYYRRAFLSLHPMLSSRISTIALSIGPIGGSKVNDRAIRFAKTFDESNPTEDLNTAFQKVPEIWQSKPDRIVVTEMFHVKAFQQKYQDGYLGESPAGPGRRKTDENKQQMARLMFWFFMFPWGLAGNSVWLIHVGYEQSQIIKTDTIKLFE